MNKRKIRLLLLSLSCVLLVVCVVLFTLIINWSSDTPKEKETSNSVYLGNTASADVSTDDCLSPTPDEE